MKRTKGKYGKRLGVCLLAGIMLLCSCGGQTENQEADNIRKTQTKEQMESQTEGQTEDRIKGQTEDQAMVQEEKQDKDLEAVERLTSEESVLTVDGDTYPLTVHDALGNEIVLEEKPERIAVMSGTLLNIWYELGGTSCCTSDISSNLKIYKEKEEEMKAIPSAGAVYSLNLESVIAAKPDLIITQTGVQTTAAAKLKEMGYTIIETNAKTLQSLGEVYEGFGKLLGATEQAEQKVEEIYKGIAQIQSKLPKEKKTCVILYVTSNTVSVKLDSSIAGDISYMLGLENIASGLPADTLGSENTPLDIEYIVEQNPDYVFVTSMVSDNDTAKNMVETMFHDNPAWSTVKAISEGNIIYLPQQYYLYNAGPYYLDAVEYMAASLYPEIYGEIEDELD